MRDVRGREAPVTEAKGSEAPPDGYATWLDYASVHTMRPANCRVPSHVVDALISDELASLRARRASLEARVAWLEGWRPIVGWVARQECVCEMPIPGSGSDAPECVTCAARKALEEEDGG